MKGRRLYDDGGVVANTILEQLGGAGRLRMMTGAYNFYDLGNGLSFKIKNQRANYIKITLTPMDLYDVEVGRIRGNTYKVVQKGEGLYFDQLKPFIEKATGMYLSLFGMGGMVEHKTEDGETIKYKIDTDEMSVEVDYPTMEYLSENGIVMKRESRKLRDTYIFWYDQIANASKEELEEVLEVELPVHYRKDDDDDYERDDYAHGGELTDAAYKKRMKMFGHTPYGKTKGKFKVTYNADGEPQTEIWESMEMAKDSAKRYSRIDEFSDVKIFDESGKEIQFMARGGEPKPSLIPDYSKISGVVVEGIDTNDAPDFVDAYIVDAYYDGEPMTDEQLEELNYDGDFVYSAVERHLYADGGKVRHSKKDKLWESIKNKFSEIFYLRETNPNEIFSNDVTAEKNEYLYFAAAWVTTTLSFEEAENKFMKMLTDDEKKMIKIERNVKDINEAFGLMSEKKILVKRIDKMDDGGMTAGRWYRDNTGEEFKYIGKIDEGADKGKLIFSDGSKRVFKTLDDFGGNPRENKIFGFFAKGGKVKKKKRVRFVDKVESIADRLDGTKVPKRLKKDYGGRYNREEAEEAGRRIAGAQLRDRKMMADGGVAKEKIRVKSYNIHGQEIKSGDFVVDYDNQTIQFPSGKIYKVEPDREYTVKFLKTKVKASGGIKGLVDFIKEINVPDSPFNPAYTSLMIEK